MKAKLHPWYFVVLLFGMAYLMQNCQENEIIVNESMSNEEFELSGKGQPTKLTVCHFNSKKGTYKVININEKDLDKHLGHEDTQLFDNDNDGYFGATDCYPEGDCDDTNPDVYENCDNLPELLCSGDSGYCEELILFEPSEGDGYIDYPINDETAENRFGSYVRRDVVMAVKYAAAKVKNVSSGWETGNGAPIGLGMFSEADGSTPTGLDGRELFPAGSHDDGLTGQVSYYQIDGIDNMFRTVCSYGNNCTDIPDNLDAKRTALFIASLAEHPRLRVVGLDSEIASLVINELDILLSEGIINLELKDLVLSKLGYGPGWEFHYLFMTISFNASIEQGTDFDGDGYFAEDNDCDDTNPDVYPGQTNYFAFPYSEGSYDYNCDQSITMQRETTQTYSYEIGYEELIPGVGTYFVFNFVEGWETTRPECGETKNWVNDAEIDPLTGDRNTEVLDKTPYTQKCH